MISCCRYTALFLLLFATIGGCITVLTETPTPRKAGSPPAYHDAGETTDTPMPSQANNLPAIRLARETNDKLQSQAREIRTIGNDLDTVIAQISTQRALTANVSAGTVIKPLIETTTSLRELANVILDKGDKYVQRIDNFTATLRTSPDTFAQAASLFRSFAEEEAYTDLADDYRQVATLFDNLATRTQVWSVSFQKEYDRDQFIDTLKYIRHQQLFLDRFEAALYAQDGNLQEIDALLRDMANYTRRFEQFRTQIRGINAAFRNAEAITTTQQRPAPPTPSFPAERELTPPSLPPAPPSLPKESPSTPITSKATASVSPTILPTDSPGVPSENRPVPDAAQVPTRASLLLLPSDLASEAEWPKRASVNTVPANTISNRRYQQLEGYQIPNDIEELGKRSQEAHDRVKALLASRPRDT